MTKKPQPNELVSVVSRIVRHDDKLMSTTVIHRAGSPVGSKLDKFGPIPYRLLKSNSTVTLCPTCYPPNGT